MHGTNHGNREHPIRHDVGVFCFGKLVTIIEDYVERGALGIDKVLVRPPNQTGAPAEMSTPSVVA